MENDKPKEMRTSNFGEKIVFYQENNFKNNSERLGDLISENSFKDFNSGGITSYLSFRYPIGDLTMFDRYKKVPCGCRMENEKIISEWYPKFEEKKISFEKTKKMVEEILIESIRKLTEGKKIAILLSGGLDSSLIAAICKKLYPNKKIYTYSAGFYGDDEFKYSRQVSKQINSIHKEKLLYKEDYIGNNSLLRLLIRQKGEPLHPNEIALAEIEKIAKEDGCEIALCGEGSDDIFGGYGQNFRMYMNHKKGKPFFKFFLGNYRYFTLEDREKIIRDEYLLDDFKLLCESLIEKEIPRDIRNKIFYFTQKIHTPGLIIRGSNAMRFNNLESGFPYIDSELVDFVNSLPFDFKVRWKSKEHEKKSKNMYFREISEKMDIPKYILKKIAEKYLPHEIIYRSKKGFPVPFDKWFGGLKEWPLNKEIFKSNNISSFNGWKKFMLINLNTFVEEFSKYKK